MENASKALLISGGILIAMLILSIGVYLFITYGQLGEYYEKSLTTGEIRKFNSNFVQLEGRENITAQEIVTLYKFVKTYNEKNDIEKSGITISVIGADGGSDIPNCSSTTFTNSMLGEEALVRFIKQNSNDPDDPESKLIYFKCTSINYDENTGMVNEIRFEKAT